MVYSASSARTLLQGHGDGTTYLVRYVGLRRASASWRCTCSPRRGLDARRGAAPGRCWPSRSRCLVAVKLPGIGVDGQRRAALARRRARCSFQPSELMKLALVLYAAKFLAAEAGAHPHAARRSCPLLLVAGAMLLLVASQPDLGTALVIAFTLAALLVAGRRAAALPGSSAPASARAWSRSSRCSSPTGARA